MDKTKSESTNKAKIVTMILSYLLGFMLTIAAAIHLFIVGMSHGSSTPEVWYEPLVIPGLYLVLAGPAGILIAVFLYVFIIGSLIYFPIKFLCQWK